MQLASQAQVESLDPEFGEMAVAVGRHAWSIPQLTTREKAFIFIAADMATGVLGFPLATHVRMAGMHGVTVPECRAAVRHLAPYVSYPTAAVALQQLNEIEPAPDSPAQTLPPAEARRPDALPAATRQALTELDENFAAFFIQQFDQRWVAGGDLSRRERALSCLAVDVLHQTLDESFDLHADLALAAGATGEHLRAVLLLVAEYGMAKSWRAYRALQARNR